MPLCCHIVRHQSRVIAAHRTWCIEQRSQQILPDIPNPRCVLLQAIHDETDVLTVQLQQLRPHDLGWVVIACNTLTVLGVDTLKGSHAFEIVGMSKGAQLVLAASCSKKIGVFATELRSAAVRIRPRSWLLMPVRMSIRRPARSLCR